MRETDADLTRLQNLLEASHVDSGEHLDSIITEERRLSARQLAERLGGMRLLALATSTADGRPLVSPVDGIFFRGEFWFGSAHGAVKMRHVAVRPDVSATYIEGEQLAVTVHGKASIEGTPGELAATEFAEVAKEIYGPTWTDWADGALYARVVPEKMFVFHMEPSK